MNKQDKTERKQSDVPMRVGTGLPGPGRPKKSTEVEVARTGLAAIKKQYGSLEKGFQHLLGSKEPSLIKLVFEYAIGKPIDKIENVNGIPFGQINIQVVATKKRDDETGN